MFKEIEKIITNSLSDYNKTLAEELNIDITIINNICSNFFSVENKPPIVKKTRKEIVKTCTYVFTKGKKNNETCGASIRNEAEFYCSKHSKFYKKNVENNNEKEQDRTLNNEKEKEQDKTLNTEKEKEKDKTLKKRKNKTLNTENKNTLTTALEILCPDIKQITKINPTKNNDKSIEELLTDIFNDENEEIY